MKISALLLASATTLLLATSARADLIDINFTDSSDIMTGKAEIGSSGDQWNNIGSTTAIPSSLTTPQELSSDLIDVGGTGTGATLTVSGFDGGVLAPAGGAGPSAALFDEALFNDQATSTTASLTFTGLGDDVTYELVVYGANTNTNDNPSLTANALTPLNEETQVLVGDPFGDSTTYTSTPGPLSGTGLPAGFAVGNYAIYTVKTDGSGDLALDVAGLNSANGNYNIPGLQLKSEAVPEPSTVALMLGSMVLLGVWMRRSRLTLRK